MKHTENEHINHCKVET